MKNARKRLYLLLKRNRKKILSEWVDDIAKIRGAGKGRLTKSQHMLNAKRLYPLLIGHIKNKKDKRCEKLIKKLVRRGYLRKVAYGDMVKIMISLRRISLKLANEEFEGKELLKAHRIIGEEYDYCIQVISSSYVAERESKIKDSEKRIDKVHDCFLNFSSNPLKNINKLTKLCGQLMGATCALYNRLDRGLLCSWGQWNTPSDYNPVDKPDGHICYDVIKRGGDMPVLVSNLHKTRYARTDPNVRSYKLRTYFGQVVKFGTVPLGSLCCAFQDDFVPTKTDEGLMKLIASAIGVEEERKKAVEGLQDNEKKWRSLVQNIPDIIITAALDGTILSINHTVKGLKITDVIGKNLLDYEAPKYRAVRQKSIERVFRTGKSDRYELLGTGSKGPDSAWYETRVVPVKRDGKVIAVTLIIRDITKRKQADEVLKESEERYRAIFEQAVDSIVLIDGKTGALIDFNDRAHESLGYTRKEFQKLKIPDFEVIESTKEVTKHIEKIIKSGTDTFETKHRTKGGEIRDVFVSSRAISVGGKDLIQSIFRDITERKKVLGDLKIRAQIMDDMLEGVTLVDETGTISLTNPEIDRMFGYDAGELIGKNISILNDLSPKENRNLVNKIFKELKAKDGFSGEFINRKKDGTQFITYGKISPVVLSGKKFWITVQQDITDQKVAKEKIISIKNHLETVINGIDESIVVIDKNYTVISYNEAFKESLRYPKSKLIGNKCFNLIHKYKNPCRYCVVRGMFKTGKPCVDLHSHIEDGRKIWHEVRAYPLKSPDGKVNQAVYVFRDVTERADMEEQLKENFKKLEEAHEKLKELDNMKSEFIAMASHELQTPLSIIKGYAELLNDGTLGTLTPLQKEKVGNMVRNVNHLINLVGDILDLSRIESGELEFERRRINVNKLVGKVVDDLHTFAEKKRIRVIKKLSPKLMANADKDRISQVVRNLIDNSIKFTSPGGTITVKTKKEKGIVIEVTDTGIGIPKNEIGNIFDSFYRIEPSVRSRGLGLGLKICKKIIEAHNGSITIKSKVGVGTTVTVRLPAK